MGSNVLYKDVVVIGNGPSGIATSYFLSGNWPYYDGNQDQHPSSNLHLHYKLRQNTELSLIEQDLGDLSENLFGRSPNPIGVLLDCLQHPDADLGEIKPSALYWKSHPGKALSHIVIGKGPPGGSWHKLEDAVNTLSLGNWMELPDLPFVATNIERNAFSGEGDPKTGSSSTRESEGGGSGGRNKRVRLADVRQYYLQYVKEKELSDNFFNFSTVTSVEKIPTKETQDLTTGGNDVALEDESLTLAAERRSDHHGFWRVSGYSCRPATDRFNKFGPHYFRDWNCSLSSTQTDNFTEGEVISSNETSPDGVGGGGARTECTQERAGVNDRISSGRSVGGGGRAVTMSSSCRSICVPFTIDCKFLILATGIHDCPNKLNIPGENLDFVEHSPSQLVSNLFSVVYSSIHLQQQRHQAQLEAQEGIEAQARGRRQLVGASAATTTSKGDHDKQIYSTGGSKSGCEFPLTVTSSDSTSTNPTTCLPGFNPQTADTLQRNCSRASHTFVGGCGRGCTLRTSTIAAAASLKKSKPQSISIGSLLHQDVTLSTAAHISALATNNGGSSSTGRQSNTDMVPSNNSDTRTALRSRPHFTRANSYSTDNSGTAAAADNQFSASSGAGDDDRGTSPTPPLTLGPSRLPGARQDPMIQPHESPHVRWMDNLQHQGPLDICEYSPKIRIINPYQTVVIAGAGLSAADAVLTALHMGIHVIHVIRRIVHDKSIVLAQLPQTLYPEYNRVLQLMKGHETNPLYQCIDQHVIVELRSRGEELGEATIQSLTNSSHRQSVICKKVLLQIGFSADLRFLPNHGRYLARDSNSPITAKSNPILINPMTHEALNEDRLFAVGPLVGDNFVRFVQGASLAILKDILQKLNRL